MLYEPTVTKRQAIIVETYLKHKTNSAELKFDPEFYIFAKVGLASIYLVLALLTFIQVVIKKGL